MKKKIKKSMTLSPANVVAEDLNNDAFFADLDVAFDAIQMDPQPQIEKPKAKKKSVSRRRKSAFARKTAKIGALALDPMQATFVDLAKGHLKPIARYLKAIRQGISSKDLLEVIILITEPLAAKTKKVGLDQHAQSLRAFNKVVKTVLKESAKKIKATESKSLVFAFAMVTKDFALDYRGHSTAVLNVLAFYRNLKKSKSVKETDIKKLFAIGVPSLTMLRQTSLEELNSLTGIPMDRVTELRKLARRFTLFELV